MLKDLTEDQQQFILFDALHRCTLFIPKDLEESTADEDIEIKMKPLIEVNFYRALVGEKYKYPLTMTLLGCDNDLVGLKAVLYNPCLLYTSPSPRDS